MEMSPKSNQHLMKAIKRMHTLVESDDLEKVRASQENISAFSKSRDISYEDFVIGNIPAEWMSVKRHHMRKYVILYCHGGGYNTGSYGGGGCSACDLCSGLICADCCCECMGGDLIRCC